MQVLRELINEQRKRLLARILGHLEEEVYPHLPADVRAEVEESTRALVRGALSNFHEVMLDVVKVSDENVVRNEHVIALLRQIHARVR